MATRAGRDLLSLESLNEGANDHEHPAGREAPNFTANTTEGPIEFHGYLWDGWGVLFSHPADFTPVCTTELGRVASLKEEFDRRNTRVIAISVDPLESQERWLVDIYDVTGYELNFPVIADPDREVADLYRMIHPNASDTMTVRSVGRPRSGGSHRHRIRQPPKRRRLRSQVPATSCPSAGSCPNSASRFARRLGNDTP